MSVVGGTDDSLPRMILNRGGEESVIIMLFAALLLGTLLSLLLTPLGISFAHRVKAVDVPDARKVHTSPIPRLGGVAVFLSAFTASAFIGLLTRNDPGYTHYMDILGPWLLAGTLLMVGTGIVDDIKPLAPFTKFLAQLGAAGIVVAGGLRIDMITNPFGGEPILLGWASIPVSVFWIVALTNAANLIDGLDGLASGIGAIVIATIGAIALSKGNFEAALLSFSAVGALLGFLRYNRNPAKVFLGDSGSLLIGFLIASLSIMGSAKGSAAFAILIPIVAMGLPLFDMLYAIVRRSSRAVRHLSGEGTVSIRGLLSAIAHPDRGHIHHRLLTLGFPQDRAVNLLYAVSFLLAAGALSLGIATSQGTHLVVLTAAIGAAVGIRTIEKQDLHAVRDRVLLPVLRNPVFQSRPVQMGQDMLSMLISFLAANHLAGGTLGTHTLLILIGVWTLQMGSFLALGVYRISSRQPAIGDALTILYASLIAATLVGCGLLIPATGNPSRIIALAVFDFFFLAVAGLIPRFAGSLVESLGNPQSPQGKRVLIYGAGQQGLLALQMLQREGDPNVIPIGFIDEDPRLEGKTLDGLRIYGGHWAIPKVLQRVGFEEILLASSSLSPEVGRRLKVLSRRERVVLKRLSLQVSPVTQPSRQVLIDEGEQLLSGRAEYVTAK